MVEPRVQMKRPSRSAESEYRVIPREFTSTVVPSFGLGAVLTTSPDPVPFAPAAPVPEAADEPPQPAASATADKAMPSSRRCL